MREDYILFMTSLIIFVFAVFIYLKRENRDFERLLHRLNGIQATADDACRTADAAKKTSAEFRALCLETVENTQAQIASLKQQVEQPKPITVNLSSIPIEVVFQKPAPPKKKK